MIKIGISPIAFTIGTLSVTWYGIIVALAILVIVLWLVREVRKGANLSYDTVFTASIVGIPAGIIMARLLHVVDKWDYYSQNLGQIVGTSGLTIYGAVLGAALAIWIYSRISGFKFGYFADLIAPAIILAQSIGRLGCILNGCCYGAETSLFWGIVYTHPESSAPLGIAVHPTQIYEILYNLMVFGILLKLRGKFKPDGSIFLIYLSLYSAWRIGIGFLRDGTPFLFNLQQAQVIGIIVLAICVSIMAFRTRRVKIEN
ncbi:MAG: prolipoprotein diacylglyceryl transferase [Dehalococcoidales bacterium]|nr:prolipoprotein diacylglyceryl transferase [Dehalococcoidales bacterium]